MKENDGDSLNLFLGDNNSKKDKSNNNTNKQEQNQIMMNKSDYSEILADESVIKKIKESEQLSIDKMKNIIDKCFKAKRKDPNANIIDEDFLRLVWSFNFRYYKAKNKTCSSIDYASVNKNQLNNLVQQHPSEFFHCLYKLDIKFDDLYIIAQEAIKNSDYNRELSSRYPNQYNITHKPWRNSIADKMFYDSKKTLDVKFFVWLNENGYFAKHDEIVFYQSSGHHFKASSEKLPAIDEFENICKKRKEERIGNYKFETFDEFKKFVGLDKDDDQYKKEYYPNVAVSVKSLSEILKKENKFLTKDEFIKLINRENIFFDKPGNLTEDDIKGWDNYKDFVNKLGKMTDEERKKRRESRKKLWEYMEHILFGNPRKQNTQGLTDIRNLDDADLENIADCLSKKFEFFTGISLLCDNDDIFDNKKDEKNNEFKYRNYIVNSLKNFKGLFPLLENCEIKPQIKIDLPELEQKIKITGQDRNKLVTSQNATSSWKRLTAGIILLVFGVIGCGSVVLGLGLASKLAVALLFLFVFMIITGTLCLLWKKISDCLAPCCSQIFDSRYQKSLIDKSKIIKQEINFNLTTNNILQK